eukprot:scaffold2335_cov175-Amphora_coffeaeformis.AAC.17
MGAYRGTVDAETAFRCGVDIHADILAVALHGGQLQRDPEIQSCCHVWEEGRPQQPACCHYDQEVHLVASQA